MTPHCMRDETLVVTSCVITSKQTGNVDGESRKNPIRGMDTLGGRQEKTAVRPASERL